MVRATRRVRARHCRRWNSPSGACRDLAVLMIAGLRSLGLAARFVSGYLNMPDPDDDSLTGGNTHAWVQAYVPAQAGLISIHRAE